MSSATARAAVLIGPGKFELREIPLPEIGRDDALIRMESCGVCGTDLEQYHGEYRPIFPTIPGHEPLGIVAEIGDRARQRWQVGVGDRIAVYPRYGCGSCDHCLRCEFAHCVEAGIYGFSSAERPPGLWGGYSDYLYIAPGSKVRKIRRDIPAHIAVQFNPLGAGFSWAVNVPRTGPGDDVVILGCGQRGLASLLAARTAGARRVIMTGIGRDARKLALATELGADTVINVDVDDVVEQINDITDGVGARVVVDTTPRAPRSVTDAIEIASQGGTVVLAGLKGERPVPKLLSDRIVRKELTVRGVLGVDYQSLEQACELIESEKYPLGKLHTHTFDICDAEQALRTLSGDIAGEHAIHITIEPT